MTDRVFRIINRFFEGAAEANSTPSGDARGHMNRDHLLADSDTDESGKRIG